MTKSKQSSLRWLVTAAGGLTWLCTLLGFAGAWDWRVDLLNHFHFQYALALLGITILCAIMRAWRTTLIFTAGLVLNTVLIAPLFVERPVEQNPAIPPIRLAAINVHTANHAYESVIAYVQEQSPDVVFFQETDNLWLEALRAGLTDYRLAATQPQDDNFGVTVMVRQNSKALVVDEASVFVLAQIGRASCRERV